MHEESRKAIIAAFAANVGIAVMKFVGFAVTGSASLLAEAGHSLADTGNQGLLMLGGKRASRRPDAKHPFGYGRERYFWSFVVALVLFSMGGLFAIFEGVDKLRHPHQPGDLWVALLCWPAPWFSSSTPLLRRCASRSDDRNGRNWWTYIRDTRTPELPVVLLEDTGALCGLLLATIGIVLAHITGNARWDAVGSLAIGALLIVIAGVSGCGAKGSPYRRVGEFGETASNPRCDDALTFRCATDPSSDRAYRPGRATRRSEAAVRRFPFDRSIGWRYRRSGAAGPGRRPRGWTHIHRAGHRPRSCYAMIRRQQIPDRRPVISPSALAVRIPLSAS